MPDIKPDDIYVTEDDKKLNTDFFNEWLRWAEEVERKSTSHTAAMFYMQKTLNDFIDSKKGIVRGDKNQWYYRNVLYAAMEVGETLEELKVKHWTKDTEIDRRKLLEEYVDIWHFIMSAAIDAGWAGDIVKKAAEIMEGDWSFDMRGQKNIEAGKLLIEMIECLSRQLKPCYLNAVALLTKSMGLMGYTFDEFYRAYLVKNFKNFARQESPEFRGGKYF